MSRRHFWAGGRRVYSAVIVYLALLIALCYGMFLELLGWWSRPWPKSRAIARPFAAEALARQRGEHFLIQE